MNSPIRINLAVLAALAAMQIACGGSGPEVSESASPTAGSAAAAKSNPCALLTPQEVETATGLKLTMREIVEENVCTLEFAPPPAEATDQGQASAPQQPAEDDPEAMAKDFSVAASGGTPKITYTIHWEDGDTVITAAKLAGQAMGSDSMTQLNGIGDEAFLGALASMLYFRVGSAGLEMDLRLMPRGQERGTKLAQQMAARLK